MGKGDFLPSRHKGMPINAVNKIADNELKKHSSKWEIIKLMGWNCEIHNPNESKECQKLGSIKICSKTLYNV